jgi:hypothetical protein
VLRKASPPPDHRVRTALDPRSGSLINQSELSGGGPWILDRSELRSLLATLEQAHPALGETIRCHLGVKTGLNAVYLNPPLNLEREVMRWAVRGRDLRPFRCECRVRLLWTHDGLGRPFDRLPPKARAYLQRHEPALRARRDYQGGPPWTLFRVRPAVARYRVVWPDLARRLSAVALTSRSDLQRIPLNSCYVAPVGSAIQADTLAAWLNSTWIGAIARIGAVPASGGFARFNARTVARLPLPHAALRDPALAQLGRMARAGVTIQGELDQLAARHLNLSKSAQSLLRAVVDGASEHCR